MNVNVLPQKEFVALYPGDGTLTKRILNRCRKTGIKVRVETKAVRIGRWRWGRKTLVYHVPRLIHDEEVARRDADIRIKKEAKRLEEKKEIKLRAERHANELTETFPQLAADTTKALVKSGKSIYSPDQIGYQYCIGTKSYWKQLGFNVTGEPNGIVVKGKRLLDTYSSGLLVPRKSRMTVERLKAQWLKKYKTKELVLANALRFVNRLQKVNRISEVYTLKDHWIGANQSNLIEGKITRVENKICWSCDGSGIYDDAFSDDECDDMCFKCDGSGIYSSRTLYEHNFNIDEQVFCFHSYVRPDKLSEEKGADLTNYGRPFDKSELPLPPQQLIVELIKLIIPKPTKDKS